MENLKKYSKLKAELLDKKEAALIRGAGKLQSKLLDIILEDFISKLDVEAGLVKNTKANRDRLATLNRIFDRFQRGDFLDLVKVMIADYGDIHNLNVDYYSQIAKEKVKAVQSKVLDRMKTSLGIEGSKLSQGGFLDSFIKDPTLLNKVKQTTLKAITSTNINMKDFRENIRKIVIGTEDLDGGFERHFKTFATDTYALFDRTTNNEFAVSLGLKYAVFAGGLIETSRPFCKLRNNKVFTSDEIKNFGTSKDSYGGYTNKSKGEFQGKNIDYDPFLNCGGYNCRHTLNYISETLAKRMRKDL